MWGSGPYGNRAPEIASSAVLQKSRTQVDYASARCGWKPTKCRVALDIMTER